MKYTFFLLTCILVVHSLAAEAAVETTTLWESSSFTSIHSSAFPSLHGTTLVWQAKGGLSGTTSSQDDWEIFFYDLSQGTVTQITDDDLDDTHPKTDGTYVIWQKHDPTENNQIFLSQVNGATSPAGQLISVPNSGDNFSPDISEGYAVWSRQQVTPTYLAREILFYNAGVSTAPQVVSAPDYNNSAPRLSGSKIIFQQDNTDGTTTLYIFDASDGQAAQPAPEYISWIPDTPQVDGDTRVLSRYLNGNREIFLHTLTEGYSQLTNDNQNDTDPVIDNDHVAWTTNNAIVLVKISNSEDTAPVATVAGIQETAFTASWSPPANGADSYALTVATDPNFQNILQDYNALNVGEATQYQVTGLTAGTTYYYRVNAVRSGEAANFSQTITVTLPGGEQQKPVSTGTAIPFVYRLLLNN